MKNIAIITARSGSKGLPDKNIKLLNGIPLFAYSIKAAIESNLFEEVMVSTDSEKYAELARAYGAQVPFLRSIDNSKDEASSWDTVREVLIKYQEVGKFFNSFCLLQPTSPLRTANDIKKAYELFLTKKAKAVVSVCEMEHSPLWSNVLDETGSLDGFLRYTENLPRQQLRQYYRINGAIYIADIKKFLENDSLYTDNCYAYVMDRKKSVDIDTLEDFKYAEWLMKSQ